jgi:predicted dehydrogenase
MMSEPIRWGILSTGNIANNFTEDLRLLPDAEVTAVGSRTVEAAKAFAARHGIPRAYGSWQELVDDPEVDVIYVANPHSGHHAATMMCLRAGKAALTEKPLTLDVPQAQELVDTARSQGVFLMEAMWTRCFPVYQRLRELVADGAIGDVVGIAADFGIAATHDPQHRLRNPALGGGALLDLGVYPVTFAHIFLGEPDEIRAWGRLGSERVDENTAVILGYDSGALATLTCSILGDSGQRATITGTTGRIEMPTGFFHPTGYKLVSGGDVEQVEAPFDGWGFHFEAAEVQRCLRAGLIESPLVPHAETLAVMRTLDAVRAQIGVTYPPPPSADLGVAAPG